jgi:hypothetical protein
MHNIMVEDRIEYDEMESKDFYEVGGFYGNTGNGGEESSSSEDDDVRVEVNVVGNFDVCSMCESVLTYTIVQ